MILQHWKIINNNIHSYIFMKVHTLGLVSLNNIYIFAKLCYKFVSLFPFEVNLTSSRKHQSAAESLISANKPDNRRCTEYSAVYQDSFYLNVMTLSVLFIPWMLEEEMRV